MASGMKMKFVLAALFVLTTTIPANAQWHRGDQDMAYQARREGSLRSLREIEGGIVPDMRRRGADYIGSEFDSGEQRYRLKFMRQGSVIWIDVDGRTGAVIARAGD